MGPRYLAAQWRQGVKLERVELAIKGLRLYWDNKTYMSAARAGFVFNN